MAITISDIQDDLNRYIGDSSTDRISAADRLNAISEATVSLQEELGNDHQQVTYTLDFLDTVDYYKVSSLVSDMLIGADLRNLGGSSITHKGAREVSDELDGSSRENSWAIEHRDKASFLAVNYNAKHRAKILSEFDSLTIDGGEWVADTTNGDATNLTIDSNEFKSGNGSLNFDLDVSQTGNDKAIIHNVGLNALDLSDYEDLGSFIMEIYIPDITYSTNFKLRWGTSTSKYWEDTVTTDIDGGSFVAGWNTIKFVWLGSTKTSTPDKADIQYIALEYTFNASQTDETDIRLDYLRIVRPEQLTFFYTSWYVGTDTSLANITVFAATSDIPYFSGTYDQYRYFVAHKAASLLFYAPLRLRDEANNEEGRALQSLDRYRRLFPDSKNTEVKNFKVHGLKFRRHKR